MNKLFWLMALLVGSAAFAEESATVNRARVNVRGGPSLASEVVTRLQSGDKVTVLGDVTIEKPKPGEPAKWSKIKLPVNTPVWVFSDFLDGDKVKVTKLNLRGGPGENFSVLGTLPKGDAVKPIRTVEGWTEIEAPESTHAFVDASYLDRESKIALAKTPAAETNAPAPPLKVYEPPAKPTENPVANKPEPIAAEPPKAEPAKTEPPKVATKEEPKPEPIVIKEEPKPEPVVAKEQSKLDPIVVREEKPEPITIKEEPKPEPAAPVKKDDIAPTKETPAPKEEPKVEAPKPIVAPAKPEENTPQPVVIQAPRVLPQVAPPIVAGDTNVVVTRRLVRREGELRPTKFNIQAPTYYELRTPKGKVINYVSAEKSGIKLKDYKGLRVMITGEEYMESRYPEIPILEVETIEVAP